MQARFVTDLQEERYIHSTIANVKSALADIGKFVEKIRIQDRDGEGTVSMRKRSEWLWKHKSKVVSSERVLDTSHKSMLGAMQRMVSWINMSTATSDRPESTPNTGTFGPPPYQEAANTDHNELDEALIVSRRQMTRRDRKGRPKTDVSITVTSGMPMSPLFFVYEAEFRL